MANGKPSGARRNSQNNQAHLPEFELPRDAVLPGASSSGNRAGDASIVNGIIEFADKEEYMDEP